MLQNYMEDCTPYYCYFSVHTGVHMDLLAMLGSPTGPVDTSAQEEKMSINSLLPCKAFS
jgi:hypothetical protein